MPRIKPKCKNILIALTPVNLHSEKEKFFQDSNYIPHFHYKWMNEKIDLYSRNKIRDNFFAGLKEQNHEKIVNTAEILFDTCMDENILKIAEDILKVEPKVENEVTDLETIIQTFKKAFEYFDLDYKIKYYHR